jgi:hypothetical protein
MVRPRPLFLQRPSQNRRSSLWLAHRPYKQIGIWKSTEATNLLPSQHNATMRIHTRYEEEEEEEEEENFGPQKTRR